MERKRGEVISFRCDGEHRLAGGEVEDLEVFAADADDEATVIRHLNLAARVDPPEALHLHERAGLHCGLLGLGCRRERKLKAPPRNDLI